MITQVGKGDIIGHSSEQHVVKYVHFNW